MKVMNTFAVAAVILAGLGFTAFAQEVAPAAEKTIAQVGKLAPDFTLTDQAGNAVSLSQFKGRIVVLEWVNSDCPIATRHYVAGTMVGLEQTYRDKGVVWLAINSTHYMAVADNLKWIEKYSVPYLTLDDHAGTVGHLYGARTTPHMYVIDAAGTLVYQGAIDDDPRGTKTEGKLNYVAQALDELLAGKPVSVSESQPYGCSVKYAQ